MTATYEKFFELSLDMLAILDKDGRFENINPAFSQGMGWSLRGLVTKRFWDLVFPAANLDLSQLKQNLSSGHPLILVDGQLKRGDGSLRMLRWTAYPDLTNHKIYLIILEDRSHSSDQEIFRQALESSPTGMLIVSGGKIKYANRLAENIFGYTQDELAGQPIEMLVAEPERGRHVLKRDGYEHHPHLRLLGSDLELIGQHKDGHLLFLDIGLNPIQALDEQVVVCSILHLKNGNEAKKTYNEKIRQLENEISVLDKLSLTDDLTTINNRRALFKQLELHYRIARQEGQPFSFVLIDVDDFKSYNDVFGHLAGDRILKTIANIMTRSVRRTEIIARYGGEEFGMILPYTEPGEAGQLAERLRKMIEEYDWPLRKITISAGTATINPQEGLPDANEGLNKLVMMADQALYHSKNNGKNRVTSFIDLPAHLQQNLSDWKIHHETPTDH